MLREPQSDHASDEDSNVERTPVRFHSLSIKTVLAFTACVLPVAANAATPRLTATPSAALFDQVIHIHAGGLAPKQAVRFVLQRQRADGLWQSSAGCTADQSGSIDLAKCVPQKGTYAGADVMGLFWALRPLKAPAPGTTRPAPTHVAAYTLQMFSGKNVLATTQITRSDRNSSVQELTLPAPLVGTAFAPTTPGKHPAMLLVGGSEGGHSMDVEAALLASHGFVTLSLAYFGLPGLPQQLVNVPLETIKGGLDFLAARSDVDPNRIGMMGVSKGGELTLLSASMFPQIKAAVGIVPSSVVWMGIDTTNPQMPVGSWSYEGKPLAYVPGDRQAEMGIGMQFASGKPVKLEPLYTASLANAQAVASATIPVEKTQGPVLLVSGDSDRMWPSTPMSDAVMARLSAMHHPYPDQHLHYKDAGHTSFFPYSPTYGVTAALWPGGGFDFGGTEAGDARAAEDAWPKIVKFLNTALSNTDTLP